MSAKQVGIPGGNTEQPELKITVNEYGVWRISQEFICAASAITKSIPKALSANGTYSFALFAGATLSRIEGDLATLTFEYVGIQAESPHLLELVAGTAEDPVETNQLFKDLENSDFIAIKCFLTQAESNPNATVPTGTSDDATVAKLCSKKLKGIDSYLLENSTLKETWYAATGTLDISGVGFKTSPPSGAPTLGGSANWLLSNYTIKQNGGVYEIAKEYRASGPLGWDSDLYTQGGSS